MSLAEFACILQHTHVSGSEHQVWAGSCKGTDSIVDMWAPYCCSLHQDSSWVMLALYLQLQAIGQSGEGFASLL